MGPRLRIVALVVLALAACAPAVDGPTERRRAADREDADRLAAQLTQLPGTVTAGVTVHRPAMDPLALAPASPATGLALIVVDDSADRDAITRTARSLFAATAPEVAAPAIEVVVGGHRPQLASVGPFTVSASSARPLRAVLAGALGLVALLAAWIALRESQRRGNSAQ